MQAGEMANFYAVVYRLVAQIPMGKVATYGQIARLLGHPSAARAVGYALHALPTGSDIPWQRVINAAGRISSRCHPHAEAIQRALLEAEGVRFEVSGAVNLKIFRWPGPSADEPRCGQKTQQHQQTDQQQDDGHIQPQGTRVQAARDRRAQLPAQDHAGGRKDDGAQQHRVLFAKRRQKRSMQAHHGRRQAGDEDHQHR